MQDSPSDLLDTCAAQIDHDDTHISLLVFEMGGYTLPCMVSVDFVIPLSSSKHNSLGVDHNHVVAHVN